MSPRTRMKTIAKRHAASEARVREEKLKRWKEQFLASQQPEHPTSDRYEEEAGCENSSNKIGSIEKEDESYNETRLGAEDKHASVKRAKTA